MLVTLIVIGALLAGGAVLVSLQMSSNRSVDLTRTSTSALYCAEAGMAAARPVVAANYAVWGAANALPITTEPLWLYNGINATGTHNLDALGGDDFQVTLKDNGDEGATDDPTSDTDLQVFIIVKCIRYPDTEKEVSELVLYNGATACIRGQQGGCVGDGHQE